MQDVAKFLKKFRNFMIVFSVIYLIVGVALLIQPERMSNLLGLLIGAIAFVMGVYRLISYFRHQRIESMLATDLFVGVCLLVFGFLCLVYYKQVLSYVPVIFGIMFIAGGVMKLQNAVNMQKLGFDNWWIALLLSMMSLGGALLSIIRPAFIEERFLTFVAVMFIYEAVSCIATLVLSELYYRELRKNPQLAYAGRVRAEAFAAAAFGARPGVPVIAASPVPPQEAAPQTPPESYGGAYGYGTDQGTSDYAQQDFTAQDSAAQDYASQDYTAQDYSSQDTGASDQSASAYDSTAESTTSGSDLGGSGNYGYNNQAASFDDSDEIIASASFEPTGAAKEKKNPFEFLKFWKKKAKTEGEEAPAPASDTGSSSAGSIQDEVIRTADAQEAQYHPLDDDPFSSNPTNDASMPGVSFDADGASDDIMADDDTAADTAADDSYADSYDMPEDSDDAFDQQPDDKTEE